MAINLSKNSNISDYQQLIEIRKKSRKSRFRRKLYISTMIFMICVGFAINVAGFVLLEPSVVNFLFITLGQTAVFIGAFCYYELYLIEKGGRQS